MRKAFIAAGGLALALTLGGCGDNGIAGSGSPTFDDAQKLAAAAVESMSEAKSAKFTMSFTGMGQTLNSTGVGRFDGPNTVMSMTMQIMGQTMETRMVDKAIYTKMPGMPGADPAKPWIKMSLEDIPGGGAAAFENSDPAKVLDTLVKSGKITKTEQAQLDGVDTTHYVIDVDMVKMMRQVSGGTADPQFEKQLEQTGMESVPMELWLNSDNLPVQYVMDMSQMMRKLAEKGGSSAPAGESKMTMKYTDWGTEVDVQAPPADQVNDFKMPTIPTTPK